MVCKDVVLCLCYQPPGMTYKHPNTGRGVASQAVYVVSGDYIMVPNYDLAPHITPESHPALHIQAGEIVDLEKYMNICTIDTAGSEGVMMIHINPLSGQAEFNCDVVMGNQATELTVGSTRTVAITLHEPVFINDVELSLLNRVRLKKNSTASITTADSGVCLILEKREENQQIDQINAEMIQQEELTSKWSKYHKYKLHVDFIEQQMGAENVRADFTDTKHEVISRSSRLHTDTGCDQS